MRGILAALLICANFAICGAAFAAHGHYISGVEGLKAASLPPEGFYWRMYNVFYTAGEMRDNHGDKAAGRNTADVYALVNRFIWSSDIEILGGNLVMDAVVPLTNTNLHMGSGTMNSQEFGVGDILVEPFVLAWHGDWYDAVFGVGVYMPTGDYSKHEAASPGKGFWTGMASLGGTVYFDAEKTWSASLLARYEVHSKQHGTDVNPGDDFHFEWGIGKNFDGVLDVGIAGYCQWQVSKDSGGEATYRQVNREQAYAVGPEIGYTIVPWGLGVTVRSLWEFENKNTTQGNITSLVLTKAF